MHAFIHSLPHSVLPNTYKCAERNALGPCLHVVPTGLRRKGHIQLSQYCTLWESRAAHIILIMEILLDLQESILSFCPTLVPAISESMGNMVIE